MELLPDCIELDDLVVCLPTPHMLLQDELDGLTACFPTPHILLHDEPFDFTLLEETFFLLPVLLMLGAFDDIPDVDSTA